MMVKLLDIPSKPGKGTFLVPPHVFHVEQSIVRNTMFFCLLTSLGTSNGSQETILSTFAAILSKLGHRKQFFSSKIVEISELTPSIKVRFPSIHKASQMPRCGSLATSCCLIKACN